MPRRIIVRLQDRSYPILIGRGILSRLGRELRAVGCDGQVIIVTNKHIARLHLSTLKQTLRRARFTAPRVHYIPDGEQAKSASVLFRIYRALLEAQCDRTATLIAFGGGVVGDVAAFAASTFMRGIPVVQVPTTLLAQVDSAIGGKTSINLPAGKNLIGTFYQPRLVLADVALLRTLPARVLRHSLAEVIKYGVIQDPGLFRYLEQQMPQLRQGNLAALEQVVYRSARIKARVVAADERETLGKRAILNYGHTFAHAIETAQAYRGLTHGEAVALGMQAAALLGVLTGCCPRAVSTRQRHLIRQAGLPLALPRLSARDIVAKMQHDKKKARGTLRFVLPRKIGQVVVTNKIQINQVVRALQSLAPRRK